MNTQQQELFAFIIDGEVFHTMSVPAETPETARLIAGMSSYPTVVRITGKEEILHFPDWKYNYETKEFYRGSNIPMSEDSELDYEVE